MTVPFHDGEITVQTRAGVREEAKQLSGTLSPSIKPAAIEFLRTQQLAIAGTIATDGRIWASLLTGSPGFVQAIDSQIIEISFFSNQNSHAEIHALPNNSQIGLLVIDLSNRRRLRLNGTVVMQQQEVLQIQIQQSFFNCPKYIQTRFLQTTAIAGLPSSEIQIRSVINAGDRQTIAQADTFFIASAHSDTGADASHRGGYPGFVQVVNSHTLLFPDYAGNNMFQTLGNLTVNPKAGLLFVDFEQGHTLQLTGEAFIQWETEQMADFAGAQRLIQFSIEQIREVRTATPLRWQFGAYSPANP